MRLFSPTIQAVLDQPAGTDVVATRCTPRRLSSLTSDNGRGIEIEHQERIFALFEWADEAVPRVDKGLTIACDIARHLGGSVKLVLSTLGLDRVFA